MAYLIITSHDNSTQSFQKVEEQRILKKFLDIIILKEVKIKPANGYVLTSRINNKFQLHLSTGTVYNALYNLERNELLRVKKKQSVRLYYLSSNGEYILDFYTKNKKRLLLIMRNIVF